MMDLIQLKTNPEAKEEACLPSVPAQGTRCPWGYTSKGSKHSPRREKERGDFLGGGSSGYTS